MNNSLGSLEFKEKTAFTVKKTGGKERTMARYTCSAHKY